MWSVGLIALRCYFLGLFCMGNAKEMKSGIHEMLAMLHCFQGQQLLAWSLEVE